jgi:hypothetical protein
VCRICLFNFNIIWEGISLKGYPKVTFQKWIKKIFALNFAMNFATGCYATGIAGTTMMPLIYRAVSLSFICDSTHSHISIQFIKGWRRKKKWKILFCLSKIVFFFLISFVLLYISIKVKRWGDFLHHQHFESSIIHLTQKSGGFATKKKWFCNKFCCHLPFDVFVRYFLPPNEKEKKPSQFLKNSFLFVKEWFPKNETYFFVS